MDHRNTLQRKFELMFQWKMDTSIVQRYANNERHNIIPLTSYSNCGVYNFFLFNKSIFCIAAKKIKRSFRRMYIFALSLFVNTLSLFCRPYTRVIIKVISYSPITISSNALFVTFACIYRIQINWNEKILRIVYLSAIRNTPEKL